MSRLGKLSAGVAVFSLAVPAMLAGCANTTNGYKLAQCERPTEVCVIENPRVTYKASVNHLLDAIARRGIKTYFVPSVEACPKTTPYTLDYSVRRSWSYMTYVGTIWLTLRREGEIVATANYNAGELTLTKWGRSKNRMDDTVGRLFED